MNLWTVVGLEREGEVYMYRRGRVMREGERERESERTNERGWEGGREGE